MSYYEGDYITVTTAHVDVTYAKAYEVLAAHGDHVEICDDAGDLHDIHTDYIALAHVSLAVGTNPTAAQVMATAQGYTAAVTAVLEGDDVEEDYDTLKANRSVTSDGKFKKGDRLVYRDGTPTSEQRTVTRCTATCVWFEETYSMPFNPDEFTVEYYDE
jgi:hypothetical protein